MIIKTIYKDNQKPFTLRVSCAIYKADFKYILKSRTRKTPSISDIKNTSNVRHEKHLKFRISKTPQMSDIKNS